MKKFVNYVRKIGLGLFLFFLIKGLIWLAVFFGVGKVIADWWQER